LRSFTLGAFVAAFTAAATAFRGRGDNAVAVLERTRAGRDDARAVLKP
jgi:hypothetical protein